MYSIITNPSSHSGDGDKRAVNCLCKELQKKQIQYHVYETKGPGHAREIAGKISSDTIIVCGGDGTINEVINGIRDFSQIKFGFIPNGSGNDFARGLGIPALKTDEQLHHFIEKITDNQVRRHLDIGNVHLNHRTEIYSRQHAAIIPDDMRFVISSGIGFDAGVCEEALNSNTKSFLNKLHLGMLSYGAIAYRTLNSVYSKRIACDGITDDGRTVHLDRILFTAAFNLPYEGGGYRFAPDASGTDGRLSIVAIGDMSAAHILRFFPGARRGSRSYYSQSGVHHFHFKKMTVTTSQPLWLHTDGEVALKTDSVTFSLLDQKLQLIV